VISKSTFMRCLVGPYSVMSHICRISFSMWNHNLLIDCFFVFFSCSLYMRQETNLTVLMYREMMMELLITITCCKDHYIRSNILSFYVLWKTKRLHGNKNSINPTLLYLDRMFNLAGSSKADSDIIDNG
jgi:flagellar biosynthesis protein FlhB